MEEQNFKVVEILSKNNERILELIDPIDLPKKDTTIEYLSFNDLMNKYGDLLTEEEVKILKNYYDEQKESNQ